MSEIRRCQDCGAELPADAPEGLCPRCLMKAGLESQSEADTGLHFPAPGGEPKAHSGALPEVVAPTMRYSPSGRFVPPKPAELARHFPQLEILELLGQGGMGAVYKARQRQLNRLVALKILPPEIATDPAFAERFTREAQALAQFNHPHVVTVHDFGEAGGLYYFIMEFVDGLNLRQMISGGHLQPREALAIVPQVCEALQYAHDEGVVHRDIKPENILIDKKGRVKIADFGLAKLLRDGDSPAGRATFTLTGSQQVMGTPHYMAPEQMERPLSVDHRADIYSLGVVFYEILTGELPLGRFAPPSQKVAVDVRLDEVVLRSLEREPERRYQRASEVKTDVENISRTAPIPPPGPAAAAPLPAEMQQRPSRAKLGASKQSLWWFGAAVALLSLILLGAWFAPAILDRWTNKGLLEIRTRGAITGVKVLVSRGVEQAALIDADIRPWAYLEPGVYQLVLVGGSRRESTGTSPGRIELSSSTVAVSAGTKHVVQVSFPEGEPADFAAQASENLRQVLAPNWRAGLNGPVLTEEFARALNLKPAQIEEVNKVLPAIYEEYLALEPQYSEQHRNDAGHLIVRIKPFPGPIEKLENRLWSQLDVILDRQQQSLARLNLKLDPPEARTGIYLSELARPGFFGWGKDGASIEIWRVGAWYHWKVTTRGYEYSSRDPQLPEEYRRIWKEPDDANPEH